MMSSKTTGRNMSSDVRDIPALLSAERPRLITLLRQFACDPDPRIAAEARRIWGVRMSGTKK
jgi:hypothetical protein